MRFPCFHLGFVLLTVFFSIPLPAAKAVSPADVIVANARVYTMNPQQKWAEAVVYESPKWKNPAPAEKK